jgi:catechol 2,3-dioxygenase-like lactoylglutathione lyase family enzyme
MFSHMTIGTHDLARAEAFYDAVLAPLGIERVGSKFANWAAWHRPGEPAKFWVGLPFDGLPASAGNGSMVAFAAPSRAAVDAAYGAALAAGAASEGPSGLRQSYAADYYGAYIRDRDGNKIHFVRRGPE